MVNLSFGEQVKIILGRKGMTIKELAELVEAHTGKPMSRQNMTQKLGRDNFQEKDMRLIAEILGCRFQLSIMEMDESIVPEKPVVQVQEAEEITIEREVTLEELEPQPEEEKQKEKPQMKVEPVKPAQAPIDEERELLRKGIRGYFKKPAKQPMNEPMKAEQPAETKKVVGDFNPYTGKEYKTNSVRMHPKRIGYVQVYDQEQHKWNDMTEWAFLGYQERKKALLGKDYEPPIYLD